MKSNVLNNISEGLYQLDIFFPNEKMLESGYFCETTHEYSNIKYDCTMSNNEAGMNDQIYFSSNMRCIVKVEKGKDYVEEIKTGTKIPILIFQREINDYKDEYKYHKKIIDKRKYSIKKGRKLASCFVVFSKKTYNLFDFYSNKLSHTNTSYEFLSDENNINLFKYSDKRFNEIMSNYEFGEKELSELKRNDIKVKETLVALEEIKRLPKELENYFNYTDLNKINAYKKWFKKRRFYFEKNRKA